MLKKSFISLYFLKNKILLLELDSRRKKVKKYASVDLPNGLIKNNKIQDIESLARILKKTWAKFKLREKSLGIIIPEFSTFTKLLNLPKLKITELNEAVNWQAQDYLPSSPNSWVMDWEIVDQSEKGYEVLAVAMLKENLNGYIQAAEKAGLFPLAVETPSICVVRITATNDYSKRLIIFRSSSETLLVLASGTKIYGTSVVHGDQEEKIVTTASKIITHYKNIEVEKVLVGGNVSKTLIENLEKSLRKKVELITLDISGISQDGSQDYLIPICMQLNDLEEPSDPYSLNLLPLYLVEKYKRARLGLQIWSFTLTMTLFIWISFLATLGAYLFMGQQVKKLKTDSLSSGAVFKRRVEAVEEIKKINNVAEKVLRIKNVFTIPQEVFNDINSATPDGVTVKEYKMDFETGKIGIQGNAATRLSLVELKKNLEANQKIHSVEVPISSYEVESNISFGLTLMYGSKNGSKK